MWGIGIVNGKDSINAGSLFRTAYLLGADFVFTIGQRYKRPPTDTYNTVKHLKFYQFKDFTDFLTNRPNVPIIGVELLNTAALAEEFEHPHNCCYLLGAEDIGLSIDIINHCHAVLKLRGERSMNVAVAGSIIMYLRGIK